MKKLGVFCALFSLIVSAKANVEVFTAIKKSRPEYLKQLVETPEFNKDASETDFDLYLAYSHDIVTCRRAVLMDQPALKIVDTVLNAVNKDTIMGVSSLLAGGVLSGITRDRHYTVPFVKQATLLIGSLSVAYMFFCRAETYAFDQRPIRSHKQAYLEALEVYQILFKKQTELTNYDSKDKEEVVDEAEHAIATPQVDTESSVNQSADEELSDVQSTDDIEAEELQVA